MKDRAPVAVDRKSYLVGSPRKQHRNGDKNDQNR